ncbi:hypothetical protein GJ744_003524 [Endocarpon pusillum]|uniref:Uncharacterized protein n=1 Tax=Endocarpon pusillum TaxID=364733 RepID=A0A8H7AMC5_9EURO|nr:hypothetical protein GJ744_003524 [Endocarpon pusillum]
MKSNSDYFSSIPPPHHHFLPCAISICPKSEIALITRTIGLVGVVGVVCRISGKKIPGFSVTQISSRGFAGNGIVGSSSVVKFSYTFRAFAGPFFPAKVSTRFPILNALSGLPARLLKDSTQISPIG